MTQAEFRDALRILRSIKYEDLEDAGVFSDSELCDTLWRMWRDDPCRTFVLVSDKIAENVWSIVERRMRRSGTSISPAAGDAGQKALPAAELIAGQTALPEDAS